MKTDSNGSLKRYKLESLSKKLTLENQALGRIAIFGNHFFRYVTLFSGNIKTSDIVLISHSIASSLIMTLPVIL